MKKILIALIMAISVTTPIQTMAESVTQSEVEIKPSEQNIEQIIDEITSETHPINSDAIQNVKEYIIQYWGDLGYDEIAGIIGSTTDGVKSSYHIAKDKIVKYMNANN